MSTQEKCPSKSYNVEDFTYAQCTDKQSKRKIFLALHPDKNPGCQEDATNKFKKWTEMCEAGEVPLDRASSGSNPYGYTPPPPPPPPAAEVRRRAAQQAYNDEKRNFQDNFARRNQTYGSRPQTYGSRVQTARENPFEGARVRVNRRGNDSSSTCSLFGFGCRGSGGRSRKLKKRSRKRNTSRKRPRKRNTRRH